MSRPTRDGTAGPYRETKCSGTYGDRGIFIFPVQLTTSRTGNLTRLIHTLLYVITIRTYIHTYIHTYIVAFHQRFSQQVSLISLGRIDASGIE